MKNIVYSGFYEIPDGNAKGDYQDGCLVLEGGALRGIYTTGVLDAFMINGINIRNVVGTSAGALNGISYCAGQIGRVARINLGFRFDKRFVGPRAILSDKGAIGFRFLFEDYDRIEPLNKERIDSGNQRFAACLTNVNTGKTEFKEYGECPEIFKAIQASASMPYLSMPVKVEGELYLDGGCSCKVPYIWALNKNMEKVIIIRTRPKDYRKKIKDTDRVNKALYHKYPEFIRALDTMNINYNIQCEEMEKLEEEGRVMIIYPSEPVNISRLETDIEKLGELYKLGYKDGTNAIESVKAYLNR